jgi:hypothetical protein
MEVPSVSVTILTIRRNDFRTMICNDHLLFFCTGKNKDAFFRRRYSR